MSLFDDLLMQRYGDFIKRTNFAEIKRLNCVSAIKLCFDFFVQCGFMVNFASGL